MSKNVGCFDQFQSVDCLYLLLCVSKIKSPSDNKIVSSSFSHQFFKTCLTVLEPKNISNHCQIILVSVVSFSSSHFPITPHHQREYRNSKTLKKVFLKKFNNPQQRSISNQCMQGVYSQKIGNMALLVFAVISSNFSGNRLLLCCWSRSKIKPIYLQQWNSVLRLNWFGRECCWNQMRVTNNFQS